MKTAIIIILSTIIISYSTQAQKIDSKTLQLGWTFISPIILKKVKDPLTREIITKSMPKIINLDAKGATYEISNAIYEVKHVKVLNKEFLSLIEKNVNLGINAIKKQDYSTATNGLISIVAISQLYIKQGILEDPELTNKLKEEISSGKVDSNFITQKEIDSKLHISSDNKYLFFIPNETMSLEMKKSDEGMELFDVKLSSGKEFGFAVGAQNIPNIENASVNYFKENAEANIKFKEVISNTLSKELGEGQILKSEEKKFENFTALQYTYMYSSKLNSSSEMANCIVTFNGPTMFLILFNSPANDFIETSKSFKEIMDYFFIIGMDEITKTTTKGASCETLKCGYVIFENTSTYKYNFYINNEFKIQLKGSGKSEKIEIKEQNGCKLKAIQVDGYLMYPTETSNSINVLRCSEYIWKTPF